jgi:hypothetical protein
MRTTLRVLACALLLTACDEPLSGDVETGEDGGAQLVGDAAQAVADAGQDDATAKQESDASEAQDASADAANLVRFGRVYAEVFEPANCGACHPGVHDDIDLSTADAAYRSLVEDTRLHCKGVNKRYVVPGVPYASLLLDVIAIDLPSCDIARMPVGPELPAAQVALLRQWVADGALR